VRAHRSGHYSRPVAVVEEGRSACGRHLLQSLFAAYVGRLAGRSASWQNSSVCRGARMGAQSCFSADGLSQSTRKTPRSREHSETPSEPIHNLDDLAEERPVPVEVRRYRCALGPQAQTTCALPGRGHTQIANELAVFHHISPSVTFLLRS
jgi:hypothetical protein